MLKILFSMVLLSTMQTIIAQDIDVDKNTGLVKVDGKDAFYLIKKNKVLFGYDLSLQNLAKQELAYLAMKSTDELPYYERANHSGGFFIITFSETANTARLFPTSMSGIKSAAKAVVNSNLIKDQQIDPKAERAFIVSHDGTLLQDPQTIQVNVNTNSNPSAPTKAADIVIKGNSIYNNEELIGSFKQSTKDSIQTVSIYNSSDTKIAMATHNETDANADWNVITTADNKAYQFLYNASTPLEKLFKALIDKGLFN